ncbi:MAG: hypothetical protein DRJ34_00690 [Thermoprotei archaeon]|nr:MAG: hypothetical protein DRJ34_00690 [Thermoprotei archaeon]
MQKKLRRIGSILIFIGLSTIVTIIFENMSSRYDSLGVFDIFPKKERVVINYLGTRVTRYLIEYTPSLAKITVRIIDKRGLDSIIEGSELKPIVEFKEIDGLDYTFKPPKRGLYAVIIKNLGDIPIRVKIRAFYSGYDYDIIYLGIAIILIGFTLIITSILYGKSR